MATSERDDTEWVRPAVVAKRLGLSVTRVGPMIRRGHLEARKDERGHWLVRLPVLSAITAEAPPLGTLGAEEAVAMTGVPPRVFWTAVYRRRLRVLRLGDELRFELADLEAWLESARVPLRRREARSRPREPAVGDDLVSFEDGAARLGSHPRRSGAG